MSDIAQLATLAAGSVAAFGVVGGGASLELADAVEGAGGRFLVTATESAAAVMAGTLGRLTGRPGLAVGIKGPGLAVMAAGLAADRFESFPAVAAVEAYPRRSTASAHKLLDQAALGGAVAKAVVDLTSAGEAARIAMAETPGPVVVELAETGTRAAHDLRPATTDAEAERLLDGARRPVVIAGTLALRLGWGERLARLGVPVLTTAAAKGVVDERLPIAAGVHTGAGAGPAPELAILAAADLVVGLGLRSGELLRLDLPVPVVDVEAVVDDAPAPVRRDATVAAADVELVFERLAARPWDDLAGVADAVDAMRLALGGAAFTVPAVLRAVAALGDVRLVVDTGDFCTVAEHLWVASAADRFLGSGQGRFMGIGIPMALAAALVDPSVPTVLLVGDGGLPPAFAELRLAGAERLPLAVLHLSDGGFGSIRGRARAQGFGEGPVTPPPARWADAAEALGLEASTAADAPALEATLGSWRPSAGPCFVHVPFEPEAYLTMTKGIR